MPRKRIAPIGNDYAIANGLAKGIVATEDYTLPYETTEALVAKGLIKEYQLAATDSQIERAKSEGTIQEAVYFPTTVNVLLGGSLRTDPVASLGSTENNTDHRSHNKTSSLPNAGGCFVWLPHEMPAVVA